MGAHGSSRARIVSLGWLLALVLVPPAPAASETPALPALAAYLPAGAVHDPAIPTPSSVLGLAIGERPVSPAELELYLRRLAASSERVRLEEQGRTHEGRAQLLLTFSSPANLARLEELRRTHLALSDPDAAEPTAAELAAAPLVIWLAYSIHGDEASGSNAALLVAYHLAAARDEAVERLLASSVVLLDPSQNPDGMARFAQWVASHGSAQPVADPAHREKHEPWPTGRGNHYWLDLNRDWLVAEQPESQARVATFQRWRPHVVGDFHEMESGLDTYFFQPGVPDRTHPLTPARTEQLTAALARFHAAALDRAGRRYFTRESYDDFYYGKGSTYPDVQGAVGVLFEQATTAGRLIETEDGGTLSFATAVHDHVLTSFSTLEGALALRDELVAHQVSFYRQPPVVPGQPAGWVCGDRDRGRVDGLARALRRHGIELAGLARPLVIGEATFAPDRAFLLPAAQRQRRLLLALLEERREFPSTTFYDISAWTFPRAWDVPCAPLSGRDLPAERPATTLGAGADPPPGSFTPAAPAIAYAFAWGSHLAPRALQRLLAAGVRVVAATASLSLTTPEGERQLAAGAIVVPLAGQPVTREALERLLAAGAASDGVEVHAVTSGLAHAGLDLGSRNLRPLRPPRVALVMGDGVGAAAAGALWHLLDRHYAVPATLLDRVRLPDVELARYTHLLLPDGDWEALPTPLAQRLRSWVDGGGVLVGVERGASWLGDHVLAKTADPPAAKPAGGAGPSLAPEAPLAGRYGGHAAAQAQGRVAGAIFDAELDPSHPLAFGFPRPRLALFRTTTERLPAPANPYELVARYRSQPLIAGFASDDNVSRLGGSAALLANRLGEGLVVRLADDPVFRSHWHGTERLIANAIFLASLVDPTPASAR